MKPSSASCTIYLRSIVAILVLLALPLIAAAQQKKTSSSTSSSSSLNAPPKSPPAPKPATPLPPKPAEPNEHHEEHNAGGTAGHSGGNATLPGANNGNSSGASGHGNANASKAAPGAPGSGKSAAGKTETEHSNHSIVPEDPRASTGLNLRAVSTAGGANKSAGVGETKTGASAASGGKAAGAGGANVPGAVKLANGGTRTTHSDGSSVERNRSGKVTGVTTSHGATAKMDLHGNATAIHDAKGLTISRGPHGERRIETTHADHSRLVSTGKNSGYLERHFSRDGHEFAQRTYYHNGQYFTRVYVPYMYGGYAYYGYIPAFYYAPVFYGWVYNPWATPVPYVWGWYGAPWYAPYGYYFTPYAVYPAPAFWLADYALAESLHADAQELESGGLREDAGFVNVSLRVNQQSQGQGAPLLTPAIKDQIAEQVKQIVADEKDAASSKGNAAGGGTPAVPPSLDSRFTLFIVSTTLSVDAGAMACSLTAGDVIRRKDYTPDSNNTVAIQVMSSKTGDCNVGLESRMKVDDLEEMHDSFREKIDAGLKSLAENQGKNGIPSGPAANPTAVPAGQGEVDQNVADELKKQQEAADATEKDVQAASSDGGSAD